MIFDGHVKQLPDIDPTETEEWLDSLDAVVDQHGKTRARYLLTRLMQRAVETQVSFPATVSTPYVNTIPREQEPWFPGDEHIERRIRRFIRWNAAMMVVKANKRADGLILKTLLLLGWHGSAVVLFYPRIPLLNNLQTLGQRVAGSAVDNPVPIAGRRGFVEPAPGEADDLRMLDAHLHHTGIHVFPFGQITGLVARLGRFACVDAGPRVSQEDRAVPVSGRRFQHAINGPRRPHHVDGQDVQIAPHDMEGPRSRRRLEVERIAVSENQVISVVATDTLHVNTMPRSGDPESMNAGYADFCTENVHGFRDRAFGAPRNDVEAVAR